MVEILERSINVYSENNIEYVFNYVITSSTVEIDDCTHKIYGTVIEEYIRRDGKLIFIEKGGDEKITCSLDEIKKIVNVLADNIVTPTHFTDCIDLIIDKVWLSA